MFTYWAELHAAVRSDDPVDIHCPLDLDQWKGQRVGRVHRAFYRYCLYPRRVRRMRLSGVVHILDHSSAHLIDRLSDECRTVVTVHDLIPLVDPGGLSRAQVDRFHRVVKRLSHCDKLIAGSEFTKGEIERILGIDPRRIEVVPYGACHAPSPSTDWKGRNLLDQWKRLHPDGLVIGSVGSTLPRKNLPLLAKAARILAGRGESVAVARVGDRLSGDLRLQFTQALGTDCFLEYGRLSSSDLAAFYRSVDLVAVPSLFEGFGLPVIEAMYQGTPVAASEATSLPEAGGDAALYFDPRDAGALADCISRLKDASLRERMSRKGTNHASGFSWRKTLEALFRIYTEVSL